MIKIKKFRKKSVEIEATQLTDSLDIAVEIVDWIRMCGGSAIVGMRCILIQTLEGEMRANVGDWIINGIKNEFYPCKPDIFEQTYEEAS